jgi:hypothetical protein
VLPGSTEGGVVARAFLKKTLTGWAPADEDAVAIHRKHALHDIYRADIVKPRSYQHHKLCMALLSLTWKNLPEKYESLWASFDSFRKGVALEAGHFEVIKTSDGAIHESVGSLSYDALDEVDFTRVFGAMMTVCCRILRMDAPELEAEVSRYADENYGKAA